MPQQPSAQQELCPLCGGAIERQLVTHQERDEQGGFYVFMNVPAQVCGQCGEIWLPAETLRQLDEAIENAQPAGTIEAPVYDLAGRS